MPKKSLKNMLSTKGAKSTKGVSKSVGVKKGGSMQVQGKSCDTNKFIFSNTCISWVEMLSYLALAIAVIMMIMLYFEEKNYSRVNNVNNNPNNNSVNSYTIKGSHPLSLNNLLNMFNYSDRRNDVMNRNAMIYDNSTSNDNEDNLSMITNLSCGCNSRTGCMCGNRNKQNDHNVNINVSVRSEPNLNTISYPNQIHLRNHERVINPLLPPERSYENTYGIPINVATRGQSGGFQQVGMLYRDETSRGDNTVLPLYGRPIYPGANKWNYYTSSDKYHAVKMPITHNGRKCDADYGCDELYSNDMVQLTSYDGDFKVEIYDFDKPRYIPYVH
jgi:hypothetical protein